MTDFSVPRSPGERNSYPQIWEIYIFEKRHELEVVSRPEEYSHSLRKIIS
jgi:hypothetical protein